MHYRLIDKDFKEILSFQILALIGGTFTGTLLTIYTDKLLLLPGMLILLPGFLEMRGNISGSMSARLTSGLFIGAINPKLSNSRIVKGNAIASFTLAIIISFMLGIIAFLFNYLMLDIITPKIILIPLIAGIIANFIEIILTLFFTFYTFRHGFNPDNIMGSFVATTGDITSMIALLFTVMII